VNPSGFVTATTLPAASYWYVVGTLAALCVITIRSDRS
jgi:hypothetical protein